ncbi:MAG: TolC family protein [Bacteroidales bacterium]|nr:TolC family protein [Bacteroidales bacterium]
MKKAIALTIIALSVLQARAQELTLEQAIRIAQDSTIASMESRTALARAQWDYQEYLASQKLQLSLVLDPNYQKLTFETQLHYFKQRNYNMLNAFGELRLEKQASSIGGQFYAGSSLLWTEFLAGSSSTPHMFSTVPIDLGYTNKMLGYNEHKWEKQIQNFRMESEEKAFRHSLAEIALETEDLYVEYFICTARYQMYSTNAEAFEQIYEIGKEKFKMAAISKNELNALQLQCLNAENSLYNITQQIKVARKRLLSQLNIEDCGQSLEVSEPLAPGRLLIDKEEAVFLAKENNPGCREKQEDILLARQRSDKARVQSSLLQTALDVSVGIQNQAATFTTAYSSMTPFLYGGLTIRIPIVDGGLAKSRRKSADAEMQRAEYALNEEERRIVLNVETALNEFNVQQDLLERTKDALSLADSSFELAKDLYRNGETDINSFMLAQSRKDEAYMNYLNSLRTYWKSYYSLCELCVTDFRNN